MPPTVKLRNVLVANRGEIAVRIVRACFDEGLRSTVVASRPDRESLAVRMADHWVGLDGVTSAETYLKIPQIISAALVAGCDAVHPGYGFLSERPDLAEACAAHGITFVGPSPETLRRGGDKVHARELAASLGIPVSAGSAGTDSAEGALTAADAAGYPVLLKAAAGGGGRGMLLIGSPPELRERFHQASEEARLAFGDGRLFVEHYMANARHVEVQILGDHHGNIVQLGDRDCSYQRRYQKLIEEAPARAVTPQVRQSLAEAAVALGEALRYVGAGTVEFLVDQDTDRFCFLELNTRVQVEHPVTELVTGIDIVREQLRLAGGAPLSFHQSDVRLDGHAIECRINAESAARDFSPSPGTIDEWAPPAGDGVRVDTHVFPGYVVPPHYDSLLAKLIVRAGDRRGAIERLASALKRFRVGGVETTLEFHRAVTGHPDFRANRVNTAWVENRFLPTWETTDIAQTLKEG